MVWGLRFCLPMQGTRARSLAWEDPTSWEATEIHVPQSPAFCSWRHHGSEKPVHRNQEQLPLVTARESPGAATKTQGGQELAQINKFLESELHNSERVTTCWAVSF